MLLLVGFGVAALFWSLQKNTSENLSDSAFSETIHSTESTAQPSDDAAKNISTNAPSSSPTNTASGSNAKSYRPFECKNVAIVRKVKYQNNDAMAVGETRLISKGTDGYYISCTADSNGYVPPTNGMRVEPVDDLAYQGTGLDELREVAAIQEKAERDQRYNVALIQCIQNLKARGVPESSATSACRSSVKY